MATGAQAAQLMLSKIGEPTAINTCVHGLVTEIFGPLGVSVPQTSLISQFLVPPMKRVNAPFVGCVARFPRALGFQHVCMITGMSGGMLTETSFGTGSGKVRSATFPVAYFESFWTPPYDGETSNSNDNVTATAASFTTTNAGLLSAFALPKTLTDRGTWIRVGLGAIGAFMVWVALIKLLSQTDVGKTVIAGAKLAATKGAVK